jgi:holo-[acyl-carrier protein] synthase
MIVGNGVDIVEVSRIAEKLQKGNSFRDKVFSSKEIEYCEKCAIPSESYAARFAAKEAFLKATGRGMLLGYDLNEIEVINDKDGKPSIKLNGDFQNYFNKNGWKVIHVSLSHIQTMACAFVIIEK